MAFKPTGVNQIGTAPQVPIVNADGTPTLYFYRQLLALVQTPEGIQDLEILLSLTDENTEELAPEQTIGIDDVLSPASAAEPDDADVPLTPAAPFDAADLEILGVLAAKSDPQPAPLALRGLIAHIPTYLDAGDDGTTFYATDYGHAYRWSGTALAWSFLEGDCGSGFVTMGKPDGTAPNGGLWGLCDGSTYAVAQANGTTANVTTMNLTGDVVIKGGYSTGAQQAATTPTWQAGAKTDVDTGAGQAVQSGSGATVAAHTHQHNLSNANATLNAPGEANGGMPLRIGNNWYIRR
jgi:hypothetical protein